MYHYEKPFECELCLKRFYTCKTFEEHLSEKHRHSTKAVAHVLFNQSSHSPQVTDASIYNLVVPDFNSLKTSNDTPSTSGTSLNDLLTEKENKVAPRSLECRSPPLPNSPKVGTTSRHFADSSQASDQSMIAVESAIENEADIEPMIKLTLFPQKRNVSSRICFDNINRRLLES